MTVKHWTCDCSDPGVAFIDVVARADYEDIYDELLGVSQDDGKVERALVRAQEEIAKLQAVNAAARAVIIVAAAHEIKAAKLFLQLFPE